MVHRRVPGLEMLEGLYREPHLCYREGRCLGIALRMGSSTQAQEAMEVGGEGSVWDS